MVRLPDDPNNPYKSYEVKLHTGSTNGTTVTYGDVTAMGAVELTGALLLLFAASYTFRVRS